MESGPWGKLPEEPFSLTPEQAARAAIDGVDTYLEQVYGRDPDNLRYRITDMAEAPARTTFEVTGADEAEFREHLSEAIASAKSAYGRFGVELELIEEPDHKTFIVIGLFVRNQ